MHRSYSEIRSERLADICLEPVRSEDVDEMLSRPGSIDLRKQAAALKQQ